MKQNITKQDLDELIAEAQLDVKRKQASFQKGWEELKHGMKPGNLVKDLLFSRSGSNGVAKSGESGNGIMSSGIPGMAVKAATGLLLNTVLPTKSFGVTKMAAGMLVQSGLASLVTKWANRRREKRLANGEINNNKH